MPDDERGALAVADFDVVYAVGSDHVEKGLLTATVVLEELEFRVCAGDVARDHLQGGNSISEVIEDGQPGLANGR